MSDAATVRPHLERRFESHRVVFWHDPDGQYAADLDGLDLPGVQTIRVANDEYAHQEPAAARRARRASSSSTARVRCRRASATGCSIWSLPTGSSRRTAPSLVAQDLGLTADGIDEVVQAHEKFFNATKRVQSLKALLTPEDDAAKLRAKMHALSCSVSESTACWRSPARC